MTAATSFSEFTEVDALPSAKVQSAIRYRDGEGYPYHGRLGMSRHIGRAFVLMAIAWVAIGYQSLEDALEVITHIRVEVLVERQTATGVAHKKV